MEPTNTRAEVLKRLEDRRAELRDLGLSRLRLFGSFARDKATADSDVDLLAEFEPGRKNFDGYMALVDLLETALNRRVEVVTPEGLSVHIGTKILREAQDVEI